MSEQHVEEVDVLWLVEHVVAAGSIPVGARVVVELGSQVERQNRIGRDVGEKEVNGDWQKSTYDADSNETYYEDSSGYWRKTEYDANGNETYYEDSDGDKNGTPRSQSCDGKVIEVDGKKYKLTEL